MCTDVKTLFKNSSRGQVISIVAVSVNGKTEFQVLFKIGDVNAMGFELSHAAYLLSGLIIM